MALCDVMELCEIYEDVMDDKERCDNPSSIDDCLACQGTGKNFQDRCVQCCNEYAKDPAGHEREKCWRKCREKRKEKPPPGKG